MPKKQKIKGLSERIAQVIEQSPYSQLKIAENMGIDQAQISRWKKGEAEPTANMLMLFVKASKTNKTLDWLLKGVGYGNDSQSTIAISNFETEGDEPMYRMKYEEAQEKIISLLEENAKLRNIAFPTPEEKAKKEGESRKTS